MCYVINKQYVYIDIYLCSSSYIIISYMHQWVASADPSSVIMYITLTP